MGTRKVVAAQNISRMCMVCGTENASGLHAAFYELDTGELLGVFKTREEHQSYPGRLHGGILSAMLDETIGRAISIAQQDTWGVTVELTVRFKRPVPPGAEVRAVGRITKDSSRLFEGTGEIVLEDGTPAVEAFGRYLKMPIDKIADGDFDAEWFEDVRERPETVQLAGSD
jgi:uncharacterized protein (TIGR00369 family)